MDAFGRVVGGSLLTPADLVGGVIATLTLERLATGRYRLYVSLGQPIVIFAIFLLVGVASIVFSPDSPQIVSKGLVQVGGISIMLLACVATMNEVKQRPALFVGYVRLCVIVLSVVALIGVAQFFFSNAFGHSEILDFSFLNQWSGGNVWYNHGSLDGIIRANSIMQEPSALGMVLGTAAGVALIRLGLRGRAQREAIRDLVPVWSALSILAGFVVTVSLIDFFLLLLIGASLWMMSRTISAGAVAMLFVTILVIGGVSYAAVASALPNLAEKLVSMGSITSDDIQIKRTEDLSAIALAVNLAVMRSNLANDPILGSGLGAHPVTYDRENPGLGRLPAEIVTLGLNKEDAASLLVRLLSESGFLGTAVFTLAWLFSVLRARHFILTSLRACVPPDAFVTLAIGVTASMAGIGIACMARAPQYYAPWFWLPMALTVSVPEMLRRVADQTCDNPNVFVHA